MPLKNSVSNVNTQQLDDESISHEIKFKFTALATDGSTVVDTIMAISINDARKKLKQRGFLPVAIKLDAGLFKKILDARIPALDYKTVSMFCGQLYSILSSGVNILTGIHILSKLSKNRQLKKVVSLINSEIQKGKGISAAMDSKKTGLPFLLVNMIYVGELTGTLDEVLNSMSVYYEKESQTRAKIKGAMTYPAILLILGAGMMLFFMNFVLPEIIGVITESGQELPTITKLVLGFANIIKFHGIKILIGAVISIILAKVLIPKDKLNRAIDLILLHIPLVKDTIKSVVTSRFLRTMSMMIKRGIPLPEILEATEKTLGNVIAQEAVKKARDGIRKGERLSTNLINANFFDPVIVELIGIGEETGQLENVFAALSDTADKDADQSISKLVAAIEPLFTVLIGIVIATLVISMLLPIFNMVSNFKR